MHDQHIFEPTRGERHMLGPGCQPRHAFRPQTRVLPANELLGQRHVPVVGPELSVPQSEIQLSIAENRNARDAPQKIDHLGAPGQLINKVARTYEGVGPLETQVGQHRLQSKDVAVDIPEDRNTHRGDAS
jgi:hypothetical protein